MSQVALIDGINKATISQVAVIEGKTQCVNPDCHSVSLPQPKVPTSRVQQILINAQEASTTSKIAETSVVPNQATINAGSAPTPVFLTLRGQNGEIFNVPMASMPLPGSVQPIIPMLGQPKVAWPKQIVQNSTKEKIVKVINSKTSSDTLRGLLQAPVANRPNPSNVVRLPVYPGDGHVVKLPTSLVSTGSQIISAPVVRDKENTAFLNGRLLSLQMPANPTPIHAAKTITTPCYSHLPRMCPGKVYSTEPQQNINVAINHHNYAKIPPSFTNGNGFQKLMLQNPIAIPPNVRIIRREPNYTLKYAPYPVAQNNDSNVNYCASSMVQVKSVPQNSSDVNFVISNPEQTEDPIGLLVPEVELIEDENEVLTFSPRHSRPSKKRKRKLKEGTKIGEEIKACEVKLDHLNVSLLVDGKVNLKSVPVKNLFLPRKKYLSASKKNTRDNNNKKAKTQTKEAQVSETKPTNNKTTRCLVYKSLTFTHVIPLEEVISIPNEILDEYAPQTKPSDTVCNQLEKLVKLNLHESTVTPQFESLDLKTVSSFNLDSDLIQKLTHSYMSSSDVNGKVKISAMKEKLMTALAVAEAKLKK